MPRGFQAYGLHTQTSAHSGLEPGQAPTLAKLDPTFSTTNKFVTCTGTEMVGLYISGTAALPVVGAGQALSRALRGGGLSSYFHLLEKN